MYKKRQAIHHRYWFLRGLAGSTVTKPQFAFMQIQLAVDSCFTRRNMEKLSTPIDSQWPQYPENDAPFRLENFYFFNENLESSKNLFTPKKEKSFMCGYFSVKFGTLRYCELKKSKIKSDLK
jgi:hypothetical protein